VISLGTPTTGRLRWVLLVVWVALAVATVLSAPDLPPRLIAGAGMGVAIIAFQFAATRSVTVRRWAVLVATAGGLLACYAAHDGIAELVVIVAAARAPGAFDGAVLRWFVVLDTIAFAGTVAFISHSIAGLLAGVAIPLLVQRAIEHRDLVRERDRAQALLVEVQAGREAETQAAALRERGRIAREMHDVLAHSLAGLSVQLQAVRAVAVRENVDAAVLGPLDKAAELARAGLGEARAVVGALRDPVGLGVDDIPALVERHPGAATLRVDGTPLPVAAETGHAAYRAVQESLTNAARYAPGSPVEVTLTWSTDALDVEVRDEGPAPDRQAVTGTGTGLGLAGLAERVRQAGGTAQAGPRPEGGWQVHLRLPATVSEATRG
jgi:signal transduction histidine kinase